MIYALTDGHYEQEYIAKTLEGPADPGFSALVRQFESGFGVPDWPEIPPCPSGAQEIVDWLARRERAIELYRAERKRLLSGRFESEGDYRASLLKWLCEEHGYREVKLEEHCLPEF